MIMDISSLGGWDWRCVCWEWLFLDCDSSAAESPTKSLVMGKVEVESLISLAIQIQSTEHQLQ